MDFLGNTCVINLCSEMGKESVMSSTKFTPRVAVFGSEKRGHLPHRGCGLWAAGYEPVIQPEYVFSVEPALPAER